MNDFAELNNALFYVSGQFEGKTKIILEDKVYNFPGNGGELVSAGEKATFGLNKEHVLDETYRKAKRIRTADFETTFDVNRLYDAAVGLFDHNENYFLSIERYMVNMYSEKGIFKAHKDTPRENSFVGSLVVCLPNKFTGGHLNLSNKGVEVKFEWDKLSESMHQWVMFYGDVTHWIDEVTSGTRVTITYNIYKRKNERIVNYSTFEKAFSQFAEKLTEENHPGYGGSTEDKWFAIPTRHMYIKGCEKNMTFSKLKGVDKIMVQVLQSKGYTVNFGYYLSIHKSFPNYDDFRIMKSFTYPPHYIEEGELFDRIRGAYYRNVFILDKEDFEAELLEAVAAFGNEPSVEYVYESVMIMVKAKK